MAAVILFAIFIGVSVLASVVCVELTKWLVPDPDQYETWMRFVAATVGCLGGAMVCGVMQVWKPTGFE